jgi:hypothetical protein
MKLIPNAVSRQVFKSVLLLKKNSPSIMFVGGIAGVVGSTVMACKATLKLPEALNNMEEELTMVKYDTDHPDSKDIAYVYAKNVAHIGKLYAPAIIVGGISISALTGSHITLNRRNASLTAAYAAVSKAYDEYRERVKEKFGEDDEKHIYHAISKEKQKSENGKDETVLVADPNKWSPYARFFDECSTSWQKNAELNRLFVQCQQNYANQLLQARGHVFLNEIYDMLGLERSKAGQVVGWVISEDGDNYIDFGLFEARSNLFVNGWERSVLLDFNVDGVIYDKI